MDRLTNQWGQNHAVPTNFDLDFAFEMGDKEWKGLTEIFDRLSTYEDTGLTPEEISQSCTYPITGCGDCNYTKLIAERDTLKRALKLACDDAADGCCPNEMTDYVCLNAQTCPNANGNREDSGIDKGCWYGYYIQQAQEQEGKNNG